MHTQDDTAAAIVAAGADYVFTVKANRPSLLKALKKLPWTTVPPGATRTEHGHGPRVTRTIKILQIPTLPTWPHLTGATQVGQLPRTVTTRGTKTVEIVYLITSASHRDAQPADLASWDQNHWGTENRLHYVRDVTYDWGYLPPAGADRNQTRTRHGPHIMAALRNTAISIRRLADWDNTAAALRHHPRNPERAITCTLTC